MLQPSRDSRIVTLSTHLYGWLLCIGPKEFRWEYGEVMLQDFRHCCRHAYAQGGTGSVLQLWPSMFASAIVDMGAERFSEAVRQGEKRSSISIISTLEVKAILEVSLIGIVVLISLVSTVVLMTLAGAVLGVGGVAGFLGLLVEEVYTERRARLRRNNKVEETETIP